jgi:CDP-diacylglycerol--serine O-phosphatidyltransferase
MSIKNSIPNFVTCCSLISGCIACIMALRGNLPMATLWIVIAAVFDFGDGFAARSRAAAQRCTPTLRWGKNWILFLIW